MIYSFTYAQGAVVIGFAIIGFGTVCYHTVKLIREWWK